MKNFLLVDAHPIVRTALKSVLLKNFRTKRIDEAEKEGEIKQLAQAYKYDLLVLEIRMANFDFVSMLKWMRDFSSHTNILVYSSYNFKLYEHYVLTLGAISATFKNPAQMKS